MKFNQFKFKEKSFLVQRGTQVIKAFNFIVKRVPHQNLNVYNDRKNALLGVFKRRKHANASVDTPIIRSRRPHAGLTSTSSEAQFIIS
jgi:hypothetical protein